MVGIISVLSLVLLTRLDNPDTILPVVFLPGSYHVQVVISHSEGFLNENLLQVQYQSSISYVIYNTFFLEIYSVFLYSHEAFRGNQKKNFVYSISIHIM